MSNQYIQTPDDSAETGKKVDTSQLAVGAHTVQRQRIAIADQDTAAAVSTVKNAEPGATDYGLVVRQVGARGTTVTPFNDVTVGASASLVRAQNTSRVCLSITNNDTSIAVRWGDSSVTATKGQRIGPGASVQITATAAVYMVSEGDDVTVSVTEETL